jgi:hypothetical protein
MEDMAGTVRLKRSTLFVPIEGFQRKSDQLSEGESMSEEESISSSAANCSRRKGCSLRAAAFGQTCKSFEFLAGPHSGDPSHGIRTCCPIT